MSAQRTGERELVFCHACENEWFRQQNGLECPDCHSDVVEIIDEHHDPRDNHITISDGDNDSNHAAINMSNDSLPQHPLHHHNPWRGGAPDPDGGDIEHVEWNPAPGVHFTRTSFRSTSPGVIGPGPGQGANDGLSPLLQNISSMLFGGIANPQGRTPGTTRDSQARTPPRRQNSNHMHGPGIAHHVHFRHGNLTPGDDAGGGRSLLAATTPIPGDRNGDNLHAVLATLLQSMQAGMVHQGGGSPNGMHAFLSSLMGNGAHGDAVYTEEALDRIVSQLMDQTGGHSAPGPATAAAIAALPKRRADQSMLGENGKAECSVCMDAVEIGDEVTVLPCKHWFHGDCVGAWLKEHDTCPHCRQGIMPKDAPPNAETPRLPDQAPRNDQNNYSQSGRSPPAPLPRGQQAPIPTAFLQPGMQQPYMPGGFANYPEPRDYVIPPDQQPERHPNSYLPPSPQHSGEGHSRRRRSSARSRSSVNGGEGSSSGQGVGAWFRNLRGGNSSGDR